jgi:ADP-ribosylglycohydrolase
MFILPFRYTLKAMGAGFYGLLSRQSFADTILALIKEGGDADSNAAVCGAMMGARIGYSNLPKDWLSSLRHKPWLDKKGDILFH